MNKEMNMIVIEREFFEEDSSEEEATVQCAAFELWVSGDRAVPVHLPKRATPEEVLSFLFDHTLENKTLYLYGPHIFKPTDPKGIVSKEEDTLIWRCKMNWTKETYDEFVSKLQAGVFGTMVKKPSADQQTVEFSAEWNTGICYDRLQTLLKVDAPDVIIEHEIQQFAAAVLFCFTETIDEIILPR